MVLPAASLDSARDIAIIGTSLAGLRAAEQLCRAGYQGRLHMAGRETHFPPYDRPPLSKQVLSGERELEQARLRAFTELDVNLMPGRSATRLDVAGREVHLDDGTAVGFDGLLIATGASVRTLRCEGGDLPGLYYFRTAEDAARVRACLKPGSRAVIVGAGFIGSEVASVARRLGVAVTLVDSAGLPLAPQMGEVIARYLLDQHERHGVTVRLGVGVADIEGDERAEAVRLSDGTVIPADIIVVGVGVRPETGWLEGSGLQLDDGVVCDEHCRAEGGDGAVVAAGDVARWHNPRYGRLMRVEHWTNAVEQAEYAADTLLKGPDGRPGYAPVPYFWSDQYNMHLQVAGTGGTETVLAEGAVEDGRFVMLNRDSGRDVGVIAVNWPARFGGHRRRLVSDVMTSATTATTK